MPAAIIPHPTRAAILADDLAAAHCYAAADKAP
jgi:hypothetical protein